mmetsp:Transcript_18482/g.33087  ORF Transcript_18482/g.33087 Transcript_18482/m.33087 type:complete len:191 (+) Transcript_18482:32-604(+)
MSALVHKRRFHSLEETRAPKCSPGKIQFLSLDGARRKRQRNQEVGKLPVQSLRFEKDVKSDSKLTDTQTKGKRYRSANAMEMEDEQSSKRLRRPEGFADETSCSKPPNPFVPKDVNVEWKASSKKKKNLFSEEEVKRIVHRALKEQEERLTEQYNKILNDRLAEQFENFTRFNQDYVYRQLRAKTSSYIS